MHYACGHPGPTRIEDFTMNIRRLLTAAVLTMGIAAFAGPAFAGAITPSVYGTIDVSGGSGGISTSGGVTTITFNNPANIFSVSGSFDELMTCSDCVELGTPLSSNTSLPFSLFSGSNNGNKVSLSITSDTFESTGGGGYSVYGSGWVSLTNYATTLASYSMTIPSTGSGASVDIYTSTPEPGALVLFGAGLLGCAVFIGRRRRAMKLQA